MTALLRNMLGMRSDAWHEKSVSEVMALVYRDDVHVKHASKARLKDELSSKAQLLHDPAGDVSNRKANSAKAQHLEDYRVGMLVKHLLQVFRPQWLQP